jgi:hypothetical protein
VVVTVRCQPRMNPENRRRLADRVAKAAEASLAAQNYVSPVDVLVGIGWLDPGAVKRWRQGQVDYLEHVVQTNLSRISEAMKRQHQPRSALINEAISALIVWT